MFTVRFVANGFRCAIRNSNMCTSHGDNLGRSIALSTLTGKSEYKLNRKSAGNYCKYDIRAKHKKPFVAQSEGRSPDGAGRCDILPKCWMRPRIVLPSHPRMLLCMLLVNISPLRFCSGFSPTSRQALKGAVRAFACSSASRGSTGLLERYVIAADGKANPSALTSKEFLLSNPAGAYTTARTTCNGQRLFEWDTHIHRTAASVTAMLGLCTDKSSTKCKYLTQELGQATKLRPHVDATVSSAVHKYMSTHGNENELRVTVLVTWVDFLEKTSAKEIGFPGRVMAHVSALPPLPSPPVKVEVRGAPRANAAAKDSSWISERAPLEALKRSDMNELLLATPDGEIFEGSQTNFYAVIDGAVHTAGEGVLEGTVRHVLLQVCERESIPVVLTPPRMSSIGTWEGALISSTSRLLLPVDELYRPAANHVSTDADLLRAFDYAGEALTRRLRDWVREEVETCSTEIKIAE